MSEHALYTGTDHAYEALCVRCGDEWPCRAILVAAARKVVRAQERYNEVVRGWQPEERKAMFVRSRDEAIRDLAALVGEKT